MQINTFIPDLCFKSDDLLENNIYLNHIVLFFSFDINFSVPIINLYLYFYYIMQNLY